MTRTADQKRNADLAMIHVAAKSLFGDTSRGSSGRADYEDWLEGLTGCRSAGDLTTDQRIALLKRLRADGLIAERGAGGRGEGRPTAEQWSHIGDLARQMGWQDGLEDGRLQAFVLRTAKVTVARFITRSQATAVILGLHKWLAQKATKDEAPGQSPGQSGGHHAMS